MKKIFFIITLCCSTICMARIKTTQEFDWDNYQRAVKTGGIAYCDGIWNSEVKTLCRAKLTHNLSACAKIKNSFLKKECEDLSNGPMFLKD